MDPLPALDLPSRRTYLERFRELSELLYQHTGSQRHQDFISTAQEELDKL